MPSASILHVKGAHQNISKLQPKPSVKKPNYRFLRYILLFYYFVLIECEVLHDILPRYRKQVFTLDAGLLARSQYSEGPATGHLDTGFSWFPCV